MTQRIDPFKPRELKEGGVTCTSPNQCGTNPSAGIMEIPLTAVYQQVPEGYIAFAEELPGANSQGATLEEARDNLAEAISLVLEANLELAEVTP
jgi:predicted RNase H-like HicB family nuclease